MNIILFSQSSLPFRLQLASVSKCIFTKIGEGKAIGGLWLLLFFPGVFLYDFLRGLVFPHIQIGLFRMAAVALLLLVPFLLPILNKMAHGLRIVRDLFTLLLLYCSAWTIMGFIVVGGGHNAILALQQNGILLLSWVVLFLVGALADVEQPVVKVSMIVSWIVISLLTFAYVDKAYWIMNPQAIFNNSYISSYQGFSRSAMVVSLVVASVIKRDPARMIFCVASLAVLFLLGGRSELFGFMFSIFLFEYIKIINKPRNLIFAVFSLSCLILILYFGLSSLSASRQLEVFDLSKSTSWQARSQMLEFALDQINNNVLFGVYGGHILFGSTGDYAHNIFSAWVSFGVVGFGLFLAVNLSCFVYSLIGVLREDSSASYRFSFYLSACSNLLLVFSEPIFWVIPAMSWGACIGAAYRERVAGRVAGNESSEPADLIGLEQ